MNQENVRIAVSDDLPAVERFYGRLLAEEHGRDGTMEEQGRGAEYLADVMGNPLATLLVAEVGDEIVGFLCGVITAGETPRKAIKLGVIECVFVDEAQRDVGMGGRLVDKFTAWARAHGAERVQVVVSAKADLSAEFFKHFSFAPYQVVLERVL